MTLSRAAGLLETVRIPNPEQALRSYAGQFSGGMRHGQPSCATDRPEPEPIAAGHLLACPPDPLRAAS